MRTEPLYRATFTTPESRGVEIEGEAGTEGRGFLIAEGGPTAAAASSSGASPT
jgi:hypothetical protein